MEKRIEHKIEQLDIIQNSVNLNTDNTKTNKKLKERIKEKTEQLEQKIQQNIDNTITNKQLNERIKEKTEQLEQNKDIKNNEQLNKQDGDDNNENIQESYCTDTFYLFEPNYRKRKHTNGDDVNDSTETKRKKKREFKTDNKIKRLSLKSKDESKESSKDEQMKKRNKLSFKSSPSKDKPMNKRNKLSINSKEELKESSPSKDEQMNKRNKLSLKSKRKLKESSSSAKDEQTNKKSKTDTKINETKFDTREKKDDVDKINGKINENINEAGMDTNENIFQNIDADDNVENTKEYKHLIQSLHEMNREVFFKEALERLNMCWNEDYLIISDPVAVAHEIKLQCEKYKIPDILYGQLQHKKYNIDEYSLSIMPNDAPSNIFPVQIVGDGNCLFRSLSVLLYGEEEHHLEMRVRTIVEMLIDIDYMLSDEIMTLKYGTMEKRLDDIMALTQLSDKLFKRTDVTNFENDKKVMKNILMKIIGSSTKLHEWSGIWHIAAAARAINTSIICIYPSYTVGIEWNSGVRLAYHRQFNSKQDNNNIPVYIMATRLNKPEGKFWTFEHFVACLRWTDLSPYELSFVLKPGKYMKKEDSETISIRSGTSFVLKPGKYHEKRRQ